jgi:hypothetical protein
MLLRIGDNGFMDLYVSRRASTADAWSAPVLATDLSTASDESGPWLSADCRHLYFDSTRGGSNALWNADLATATTYGPAVARSDIPLTIAHDATLTADERILLFVHKSGGIDEIWESRR